jgi:sugar-specific transcriptional regulator TrmB
MDLSKLEKIGLSKNEIKVYFALLEIGKNSATPIVRKSEIPNSKIYPTMEKLISKGLVSYIIKNNVKYFQASDPQHLIEYINEKEKDLQERKKDIEQLIPKIEARRKLESQEALVYEGLECVKVIFRDILNSLGKNEEYLVFTLGQELESDKLKLFFKKFHNERVNKKIKVRLIGKKKTKKVFSEVYNYKLMEVKFANFELPTGVFIYKDKVMTLLWKDKISAFVITSKDNADSYREFFEDLWKKITP